MQTNIVKIKKKGAPRMRALLLSDLHGKASSSLIEQILPQSADVVFLCGDMMNGCARENEKTLLFFSALSRMAPTFYSLGNHELAPDGADLLTLRQTGVTLLDDRFACFGSVLIGGLSSGFLGGRQSAWMKTATPDLAFLSHFAKQKGFRILLSHHPEYYPRYIRRTSIDLVLSGHAHGGQCRLFGHGLFAPGQGLLPRLTSGVYDGRLIVSRGLASTSRLPRLFNPTQMMLIELSPT